MGKKGEKTVSPSTWGVCPCPSQPPTPNPRTPPNRSSWRFWLKRAATLSPSRSTSRGGAASSSTWSFSRVIITRVFDSPSYITHFRVAPFSGLVTWCKSQAANRALTWRNIHVGEEQNGWAIGSKGSQGLCIKQPARFKREGDPTLAPIHETPASSLSHCFSLKRGSRSWACTSELQPAWEQLLQAKS